MKLFYLDSNKLTEDEIKNALVTCDEYRKKRYFSSTDGISARESIGADILIRRALSSFFGIPDGNYTNHASDGRLLLKSISGYVSLSHTKGHCFLTVSNEPCGIDAEIMRDINISKLSERFFSEESCIFIKSFDDIKDARLAFFKIWTEHEAYFKFNGGKALETRCDIPKDKVKTFLYRNITVTIACDNAYSFDFARDFTEVLL